MDDVVFIEEDGEGAAGGVDAAGEPAGHGNEGGGADLAPFIDVLPDFGVVVTKIDLGGFAHQCADVGLGGFAFLDFGDGGDLGDLHVASRGAAKEKT